MTQGRPTKIISMIKWIRTSRLSIKNSLCWGEDSRASAPVPAGTSPAEAPGLPPALPVLPDPPCQAALHPPAVLPARPCQAVPHPEAPRPEARGPGSQAAGPAEHEQGASGTWEVVVVMRGCASGDAQARAAVGSNATATLVFKAHRLLYH